MNKCRKIGDEHFVKSLFKPGTPVFLRSPEDSAANPDRLDLDRRNLLVCPLLEGEENLRLLNFQHNLISEIQHLSHLRRLIFLDLYDNHITEISGLSALTSLRVLMLGTNSAHWTSVSPAALQSTLRPSLLHSALPHNPLVEVEVLIPWLCAKGERTTHLGNCVLLA
ncbi:UNVERIFIED_CONTAM: hypothetical protein FKN15_009201 [Acipenser sinensis]